MRRRWVKWVRRLAVAALAIVLVPVLAATAVLGYAYIGDPAPRSSSTGNDALWMGHAWVDGRRDAEDFQRLAERLRASGIRDVYVHVGPLSDEGTLDAELHPRSQWFLDQMDDALPDVRVSAWLGNVVGPEGLDLDHKATRQNILDAARTMLREGFDGIHYNFEPVPSGNHGLLRLLRRTHELTAASDGVLSMAAEPTEPFPTAAPISRRIARPLYWTTGYLHEVAERVDQVAIMVYDSGMPLPFLYGGYVVRQTKRALETVPPSTALLIGAPAYPDDTLFYRPYAETVAGTARAVRVALTEHPGRRPNVGIAMYVDFAATRQDWQEYFRGWVRPPGATPRSAR